MANVTTSIPIEWWNKAQEMKISWNLALIRGIKEISEEEFVTPKGEEIIQESWKSKAINIQRKMQKVIDDLNKQIKGAS